MTTDHDQVAARKQLLRRRLLDIRRARTEPERAAARTAIADQLWPRLLRCTTVCAYLPLTTEPLSLSLLDRLAAAGIRVLVPIVATDAPLDWTDHPSPTRSGAFGIAEPIGPRLGADAVTEADVVLVPALAVDGRGHRLGRGGGHYDRSLALLPPGGSLPSAGPSSTAGHRRSELIAVLFDDELLPSVPVDDHDIAVDAVVSPALGVRSRGG